MTAINSPSDTFLEALHDTFVSEFRLLEDLMGQMHRQRDAVGVGDYQGINDSTFATHRILATLRQARQRRRQLNLLLGGSEECTFDELETALGDRVDARLREARHQLQQAASLLAREVSANRMLLRATLSINAGTDASSCVCRATPAMSH
ncbi:MAG TPA: flagellar export chaperone FlgN, partial [Gemmatimonas sp.]|nr:flagellar export chaperone FlgN [Gemmatimonas sp.]